MPMITCPNPNCKARIFNQAPKCPRCGCDPATYYKIISGNSHRNSIIKKVDEKQEVYHEINPAYSKKSKSKEQRHQEQEREQQEREREQQEREREQQEREQQEREQQEQEREQREREQQERKQEHQVQKSQTQKDAVKLDRQVEDIEINDRSEIHKAIEKFIDDSPEAVAKLLRNWLIMDTK